MRSVHISALAALALGVLAPGATAATTFTFANPFASTGATFATGMFQTVGIAPLVTNNDPFPTIQNLYTGSVSLVQVGVGTTTAFYQLNGGVPLSATSVPGATTTGPGVLTFSTDPTFANPLATLLQFSFSGANLSNSGFGADAASGFVIGVTGSLAPTLVDPTQTKFSFGFPGGFSAPNGVRRYTADFTSSIEAVPEPASMGVLAVGALALVRRRRRA